jgi:hypothetical protein
MEKITISGTSVEAVSPEGQRAVMPLPDWMGKVAPRRFDTCDVVLPDGIKCAFSQGPWTVWVHQTPPQVFNFKWIAKASPSPFGRGTAYRNVRIALPYLVTLAVFGPAEHGRAHLGHANECFFRTAPLGCVDEELCYPALLNCSKFHPQEGRPLAWVCTQHLDRNQFVNIADTNQRLRVAFRALMHCLLETGFNYSSEHHEQSSWFSQSTRVDPRVSTVENWEAATAEGPLFVLDVPWLKTGLSVRQVAERTFKNQKAPRTAAASAGDLARPVFNQK